MGGKVSVKRIRQLAAEFREFEREAFEKSNLIRNSDPEELAWASAAQILEDLANEASAS